VRIRNLGELLKILGFSFNISATGEAGNFKFGLHLMFARAHHKLTARRKSARGSGQGELPKIWRFPFSICAMAEASDG